MQNSWPINWVCKKSIPKPMSYADWQRRRKCMQKAMSSQWLRKFTRREMSLRTSEILTLISQMWILTSNQPLWRHQGTLKESSSHIRSKVSDGLIIYTAKESMVFLLMKWVLERPYRPLLCWLILQRPRTTMVPSWSLPQQ